QSGHSANRKHRQERKQGKGALPVVPGRAPALFARTPSLYYRFFARHHDSSHIGVGVGKAAIGQSIVWIELQRLLVIADRAGPAGFAVFAKLVASQQIEAMSLRVLGWFLGQSPRHFDT